MHESAPFSAYTPELIQHKCLFDGSVPAPVVGSVLQRLTGSNFHKQQSQGSKRTLEGYLRHPVLLGGKGG